MPRRRGRSPQALHARRARAGARAAPRALLRGSALHLAGDPPVLRAHALHDHLDVLGRSAGRLCECVRQRFDDLRHGLLGDSLVVELDVDDRHVQLPPSSHGLAFRPQRWASWPSTITHVCSFSSGASSTSSSVSVMRSISFDSSSGVSLRSNSSTRTSGIYFSTCCAPPSGPSTRSRVLSGTWSSGTGASASMNVTPRSE